MRCRTLVLCLFSFQRFSFRNFSFCPTALTDGGEQGVQLDGGLEPSAVETPRPGMGMNDENLHGLMMADSPSTLNCQPTIKQPRLVAPTCRVNLSRRNLTKAEV